MRDLKLRLNWRLTLFTLFFLPLLIGLGLWQLDRAEQKTTLLENWSAQQVDTHVIKAIRNIDVEDDGTRIEIRGQYDVNRYWLKEAQIFQGQIGLSVLGLLRTADNHNVLVNMGWIPAHPDRKFVPKVALPLITQKVQGRLRLPSVSPLTDERDNPLVAWPHRVLEVDFTVMSEQCDCDLMPILIDLSREDPNAFTVIDRKLNITPEKHRGYAVQWFIMAATLILLWLLTNTSLIEFIRPKK